MTASRPPAELSFPDLYRAYAAAFGRLKDLCDVMPDDFSLPARAADPEVVAWAEAAFAAEREFNELALEIRRRCRPPDGTKESR